MRRARPAGDAALLVEADGVAARLAAAIRARRFAAVLDVIPGARTVLVSTEPGSWDLRELARAIGALPLPAAPAGGVGLAEIPVVYDGPDLAEVARLTGLDAAGVIARHQAAEYTVGWLGFSPGFGYLTGLDPALQGVQRLARPRLSVPAGSVAIAGGLACVYSVTSPGGWRVVGRTSTRIWDPGRERPALLEPGMRVRFREVASFDTPLARSVTSASVEASDIEPRPAGHPDPEQRGRFSVNTTENRPRYPEPESREPGSEPGPGSVVEVIRPGPLATIQDLGRAGLGHLGVPCSGAADAASLRLANRLAGNVASAAGLEITLGRAALRFGGAALVAVTGAPVRLTVTGGPGQPETEEDGEEEAEFGTAFAVRPGSVLRLAAPAAGLRTYLAARGGIDGPVVLGSRSSDLLSGLGPGPLRAGDVLRIGAAPPAGQLPRADPPAQPALARRAAGPAAGGVARRAAGPGTDGVVRLRAVAGPRDDWFGAGALEALCGGPYTVTAASNRTGLRLDGPALPRARDEELPSEGLVTGALQVPPDGMPILLLADHPVTGGYPVIAVVASADLGLAAQLRPGQPVAFTLSR